MDLIKALTNEQLKSEVPELNIGDTVRVQGRKQRAYSDVRRNYHR